MDNSLRKISCATPLRDEPYGTIYELAGQETGLPQVGLAWVDVDPGTASPLHFHRVTAEVYFIAEGQGMMRLGENEFPVSKGDTISIAPGVVHAISNMSRELLRMIVATGPSYDADDDIVVEPQE